MDASFKTPESKTLHYIEAFDHFEVLMRWVPVLASCPIQLICHINGRYLPQFNDKYSSLENVSFRSPGPSMAWKGYLSSLEFTLESVVIIGTMGRRPAWFTSLIGRASYYLVLHNLNYAFDRRQEPHGPLGVRTLFRTLSQHQNYRKHRLLRSAQGFIYPSAALQRIGKEEDRYPGRHHLLIPFAYRQTAAADTPIRAQIDTLKVVIPGTVSDRVRDYHLAATALRDLSTASTTVEIHLAGAVKDSQLLHSIEQQLRRRSETCGTNGSPVTLLYSYPEGLSDRDYYRLLSSADILLAPLKRHVLVGHVWEVIGQTKVSGSVSDAIYFGKPILLPDWYEYTDGPALYFSDAASLTQKLLGLIEGKRMPEQEWKGHSQEDLRARWEHLLTMTELPDGTVN